MLVFTPPRFFIKAFVIVIFYSLKETLKIALRSSLVGAESYIPMEDMKGSDIV